MDNSCLFIHKVSRWYSRHKQATWNCLGMMSIMPTVDFLGYPITFFLVLVPTSFFFLCFPFVLILFFDIPRRLPGLTEDGFPSILQISKHGVSIWTLAMDSIALSNDILLLGVSHKRGTEKEQEKRRKPVQRQRLFQRSRESSRSPSCPPIQVGDGMDRVFGRVWISCFDRTYGVWMIGVHT